MKKLIVLLLSIWTTVCFGASQQTSSTTAASLIDRVEIRLDETNGNTWSEGELLQYLNDGQRDIAERTSCLQATEDLSLIANTREYSITSAYVTVKAVIYVDEKMKNNTMEADTIWSSQGSPTTQERSNEQANNATYSRKFTVDAADEGIKSNTFSTEAGRKYFYILYVYPDDTTTVNIYVVGGDGSTELVDRDVSGLTQDAWNVVSGNFEEQDTGTGAYLTVRSPTGQTSGTWYVDDVYVNSGAKGLKKSSPYELGLVELIDEPKYWYDWGGKVGVFPTLDSVDAEKITVYYVTRPTDIVSTDNLTIPAIYDTALEYYMLAQARLKDLSYATHGYLMGLYASELERVRKTLNEFQLQPVE